MRFNKTKKLKGEKIYLRAVYASDARPEYVRWLNDKEVNQFLESRFKRYSLGKLRQYILTASKDRDTLFLAIIRNEDNKHVGNIKLGPIDWNHKVGEIGIMIGDKASWGKGYATASINLLAAYAFEVLRLHKLTAGVYENNIGSYKAFKKCGFFEEGKLIKHYLYEGKYIDGIRLVKLA